ncbi:amino acid adenylation domain-containing protein [Sorangium sp. So ce375]|uniref:amino acid adenylation domain-containing protein n=1 Tax=Sorangium sp. So ce375 TaxID=3133306 RepID=UPI003F5B6E25
MNVEELLDALGALGATLSVDDRGQIRCRAPRGAIAPELLAALREHKETLVARLSRRPSTFPAITPDPARRNEPFPLTDIQEAYWIGRSGALGLGEVDCHGYFEFDRVPGLDPAPLERALQRVIDRHDMLRAIITPEGAQRVLPETPPYRVAVLDLRRRPAEQAELALAAVRAEMSHQRFDPGRFPLFDVRVSLLPERSRVHVSLDALLIDAASALRLFREWQECHDHPEATRAPPALTFRDYRLAELALSEGPAARAARAYWFERLDELPPAPELPERSVTEPPRFVRRSARIDRASWERLKARAKEAAVTPSAAVCAAFAEVLADHARRPRFSLNLTLFRRLPLHPDVESILGEFTSTLLLAVDVPEAPFRARARALQERMLRDLEHSQISGLEVLRELGRRRGTVGRQAMPVVFTSLLPSQGDAAPGLPWAWLGELVYSVTQTPQVSLDYQLLEDRGDLVVQWDSIDAGFPPGLIAAMFAEHHARLLALADDEAAWDALATDRPLAHPEVQATDRSFPGGLLHELVAEQALRTPDALAVACGVSRLDYRELERRSNQLAHRLVRAGARRGDCVAVTLDKGVEQVIAALAVLKAAGAYVPVDPQWPDARRADVLERCGATIAVTSRELSATLSFSAALTIVCADDPALAGHPDVAPRVAQSADDLAYVIFTSGSTGTPKGVEIEHRGAVNTIQDINERLSVGPGDRVLALSALGFDLSVYDIFGLLAAGGAVVLPEPSMRMEPARWVELLVRERVTLWNTVPALLGVLVDHLDLRGEPPELSLRAVLLSGDWIPVGLPARIRAFAPGARLVALGGATEASIWSNAFEIGEISPSWSSVPYGRPLANQRMYVLGDRLEHRPVWAPGELYIGGVGLARGYRGDPARTAASFIRHPRTGERLYRTGDLGRLWPEGIIEFLGREDTQVKVAGHRIELGEIEAALQQHPAVRVAVAAAQGRPGEERRLIAFVVPRDAPPSVAELRAFLADRLPAAFLPAAFYRIASVPLSSNGKVDRRALLESPGESLLDAETRLPLHGRAAPAPSSDAGVTATITRLAEEVLKSGAPSLDDDLFRLGASSLDIFRLLNRLEQTFGSRPTMEAVFRSPRLRTLVDFYAPAPAAPSPEAADAAHRPRHELLGDAGARAAFKASERGLRRFADDTSFVPLEARSQPAALARRSHRRFGLRPLPAATLGRLLSPLGRAEIDGVGRRRYASAGGLYPVQLYLHVKPGRVEGVQAGTYYYDPREHRLARLSAARQCHPAMHARTNATAADEAALTLMLFADLAAIEPVYGELAPRFAAVEAGLMAQLLDEEAVRCGLGLCHLGVFDVERARQSFDLGPDHLLVLGLLAGPPDPDAPPVTDDGGPEPPVARSHRIATRVAALGEDEAQRMLDALEPREEGRRLRQEGPGHSPRTPGTMSAAELARALSTLSPVQRSLWASLAAEAGVDALELGPLPAPRPRGPVRLSDAQMGVWLAQELAPEAPLYNLGAAARLRGPLDPRALEGALRRVLARHAVLRSRVVVEGGIPRMRIEESSPADLPRGSARERSLAHVLAELGEWARHPFDLQRDPPWRARLLALGEDDHLLALCLHHIVADGWSMGRLLCDWLDAYAAAEREGSPTTAPLPIDYLDYCAWQQARSEQGRCDADIAYWRGAFTPAPPALLLPPDRPAPPRPTYHGARRHLALDPALAEAARALSRSAGVTLFSVLLLPLAVLGLRATGGELFTLGTVTAHRTRPELEGLVGLFANSLALRCDLRGNPSARALLARLHGACSEAFAHQEAPFERWAGALGRRGGAPPFDTFFVLQNAPPLAEVLSAHRRAGLEIEAVELDVGASKLPFELWLWETPDSIAGTVTYQTERYEAARIERFVGDYQALLAAVVASPDTPVLALPLAGQGTRTSAPQPVAPVAMFRFDRIEDPEADFT